MPTANARVRTTTGLRSGFKLLVQSVEGFILDDAMTLGASLAFYAALSISPLLVLVVWYVSLLGQNLRQNLIEEMLKVVGPEAGRSLESVIESARQQHDVGTLAGFLAIAILLFSASGVFTQLQHSLDRVWNVEAKPGRVMRGWLRKRVIALGMVVSIGFMLIVSLVASAVLSTLLATVSESNAFLLRLIDLGAPFVVYLVLFGMLFKTLAHVRIAWRDAWVGAVATAVLFTIGKTLIGVYLARSIVASAYGAAGSLVLLLLWVYYSSLIVIFGAELTRSWSTFFGRGIRPNEYSVVRDPQRDTKLLRGKPT